MAPIATDQGAKTFRPVESDSESWHGWAGSCRNYCTRTRCREIKTRRVNIVGQLVDRKVNRRLAAKAAKAAKRPSTTPVPRRPSTRSSPLSLTMRSPSNSFPLNTPSVSLTLQTSSPPLLLPAPLIPSPLPFLLPSLFALSGIIGSKPLRLRYLYLCR